MTPSSRNRPNPSIPREVASMQVLGRFVLRIIILVLFATMGQQGFAHTLQALLMMAVLYCCIAAAFRRETPLASTLTHFDEAAAYGVIAGITRFFV